MNEDRSDHPHDPDALISSTARAATTWIGADLRTRDKAVRDLLELADALPPQPKAGPTFPGKISSLHEAMKEAQISHAFGGALAVGFYGEPRATGDIDFNVFIPASRWPDLRSSFGALGIDIEIDERELRANELRLDWGSVPVHLFFSCDAMHEEMPRELWLVPFDGGTIPLVAPEHLVVRKAVLGRPKDWHDIEQILVATPSLNLGNVEHWLQRLAGENDQPLARLNEIKAALDLSG